MVRSLGELAAAVGGAVVGDATRALSGIATLAAASSEQLSFLTNRKYRPEAERSQAGALLVGPGSELPRRDLLVVGDPYHALARLLGLFYPEARPAAGIDQRAVVGSHCEIQPSAHVGPLAVIGDSCRLAEEVVVHAHAVVGAGCRIGAGTVVHPHAVLYPGTVVGEHCVIHAGVVLGSDGFGYATHQGTHVKVPQVGRVIVEDHVEIGANSTVDRAMLDETRIGVGSKIDNLVQVGHNVHLGRGCILVSQAGIAGSSRLGAYVVVAGQSGVAGHLELGDRVQVAAKSAVFEDVEAGRKVAGVPAIDAGAWRRQQARSRKLEEMYQRLSRLEKLLGPAAEEGAR